MKDLRSQVPDLEKYLYPGEVVVAVTSYNLKTPKNYPDPALALAKLCAVSDFSECGKNGPPFAAGVTDDNAGIEDLEKLGVFYGRDAFYMSLPLLEFCPGMMRASLIRSAETQGVTDKKFVEGKLFSGEEKGKIVSEFRDPLIDPVALQCILEGKRDMPSFRSDDATPLFLLGFSRYLRHTGDLDFLNHQVIGRDGNPHSMWDAFTGASDWLERKLATSDLGLLAYRKTFATDINDFWQDSWDSLTDEQGRVPDHRVSIAPVNVQPLAYDACLETASFLEEKIKNPTAIQFLKDGFSPEAFSDSLSKRINTLRSSAAKIKTETIEQFWVEDENQKGEGYFGSALVWGEDANVRPLRVRKSLMGHLLNSAILEGDEPEVVMKKRAVIKALHSPEAVGASGFRTLFKGEPRFRPTGYQTGSVWPWEVLYIANGLERHGEEQLAQAARKKVWRSVDKSKTLSELYKGVDGDIPQLNQRIVDVRDFNYKSMDRKRGRLNRIEQLAHEIQGLTAAYLLETMLKNGAVGNRLK